MLHLILMKYSIQYSILWPSTVFFGLASKPDSKFSWENWSNPELTVVASIFSLVNPVLVPKAQSCWRYPLYMSFQTLYEINLTNCLQDLESISGCNCAASVDNTGSSEKGGNWILESDGIDVLPLYFVPELASKWRHTAPLWLIAAAALVVAVPLAYGLTH